MTSYDLIHNKFYKFSWTGYNGDRNCWLFQFKKIDESTISVYNYIIENGIYHKTVGFDGFENNDDIDVFEEIEFSQIIQFLPDNHIDKITYLRKKKINFLLSDKFNR